MTQPTSSIPEPASAPEPIVGIDLGTTFSLVAVAGFPPGPEHAAPRIIPDAQGRPECPSVVRFDADGKPVAIGHDARRDAVEFPLSTITSVKRLMGRSLADAAADLAFLSYRVVEGPGNTARIELPPHEGADGAGDAGGNGGVSVAPRRTVSPQEVSAHVLSALRDQASRSLGVPVRRAVVTVPAYFDDAQRQATRDAGRLAGLDVVRIVNEPTAAALAYGVGLHARDRAKPTLIAVYDFGGGTFDVSILRLVPAAGAAADAFEVISTAGDTHLGGDDIDHALVKLFTEEIRARFAPPGSAPIEFPPGARRALVEFAEAAKRRLSDAESASVRIDLGPDADGRARVYERTITREAFEALAAPIIDRTFAACRRALRDARAGMGEEPLTTVVMVGGSTRIPLVRRRAREFFNVEPYTALNPDHVVALGAAVQGAIMAGATTASLLLDVVPLSLGIETVGGAVAKLIVRNTTVPARATERFSTSVDGQTSIKIHVLQGEREMAADCRSLAVFELTNIPAMPAGIPRLIVEFLVDANGILNVAAVEERSGRRASVQVIPNHGLTREEVERIERESFVHARDDMTRHRVVDLVAAARLDLNWTGKQLERHRDRLDAAYARQLGTLTDDLAGFVARANDDWRAVDPAAFNKAKEALEHASVRLHEIAITHSLQQDQQRPA